MEGSHTFQTLPSELLAQIMRYLGTVPLTNIMYCGCRVLNKKLRSASGVKELYEGGMGRDIARLGFFHGFARLFPHLRLLSYSMPYDVSLEVISGIPFALPSSITHLEITGTHAEAQFMSNRVRSLKTLLPQLEHLTLHSHHEPTWDKEMLGHLPATLKTLSLPRNYDLKYFTALLPHGLTALNLASNENLDDMDIINMPRSLTSLTLHGIKLNPLPSAFLSLPLQTLHLLGTFRGSWCGFKHLPMSLTDMDVSSTIQEDQLRYLPLGLQTFRLPWSSLVGEETIAAIPRQLKRLISRVRMTEAMIQSLPPSLESLQFAGSSGNLTSIAVQALPRTLRSLQLDYLSTMHEDDFIHLPRHLTYLTMASQRATKRAILGLPETLRTVYFQTYGSSNPTLALPLHALCLLPKNVTRFTLDNCALTDECIEFLATNYPAAWQRLELIDLGTFIPTLSALSGFSPSILLNLNLTYCTTTTPAILNFLPANLQTLRLSAGRAWTNEISTKLPPTLTELCIASAQVTDTIIPQLPRSLVKLDLALVENMSDDALAHLPPGITSIALGSVCFQLHTLRSLQNANSSGVVNMETLKAAFIQLHAGQGFETLADHAWKESLADEHLQYLPHNTHTFHVNGNLITDAGIARLPSGLTDLKLLKAVQIDGNTFGALPRSLVSLCLPYAANVTDESIAQLPPTLTMLDLGWAKWLTSKCIQSLPRTLLHLNLSSAKITNDSVPHLPPNLVSLIFTWSKLTHACARDLPRTLTEFDCGTSTKWHDTSVVHLLPPNLTEVKWDWSKEMILSCQKERPLMHIPQSALVRAGLVQIEPHYTSLIQAAPN